MGIGLVVTIKTQPGKGAILETVGKELMAEVRKNEPGNNFYEFFKADEDTYIVLESYKDQAALEAHRNTEHFKRLGPKMGEAMAGRPEVKMLQSI